jgi:hypothetical protein
MMTNERKVSKTSIDTLSAISAYRRQHRSGRVRLVGGKRISPAAIARLAQRDLLKETAFNGRPALVLTERGRQLVSGSMTNGERRMR